ncbi:GNAT family N-acetyltransferase [Bacillus sp. BGMRC 2118]|nr:GNAT family N-acetyltransferase [Bacillus sp. BGMRC 2118]
MMNSIETERLEFIPMTKEAIKTAILGEKELRDFLGVNIVYGLIEPIIRERVLPIRLNLLNENPSASKWYGFVVEKTSKTVIGMMGFKTSPNGDGLIEIGYGIHTQFQGNGYANEMVQGLIDWAFQQPDVKGITATNINKDNYGSIKIVEKVGMTLIQENKNTLDYIVYK